MTSGRCCSPQQARAFRSCRRRGLRRRAPTRGPGLASRGALGVRAPEDTSQLSSGGQVRCPQWPCQGPAQASGLRVSPVVLSRFDASAARGSCVRRGRVSVPPRYLSPPDASRKARNPGASRGFARGDDRNRTGVDGFAGRCVATPPRRQRGRPSLPCRGAEPARRVAGSGPSAEGSGPAPCALASQRALGNSLGCLAEALNGCSGARTRLVFIRPKVRPA